MACGLADDKLQPSHEHTSFTVNTNGQLPNHEDTVISVEDHLTIGRPSAICLEDTRSIVKDSDLHGTGGPQTVANGGTGMATTERKTSTSFLNESEDRGSRWSIGFIRVSLTPSHGIFFYYISSSHRYNSLMIGYMDLVLLFQEILYNI